MLAWADTRNGQAQHDSVSHALAVIERLGYESGAYDTYIRTDSHIISKTPKKTSGEPASGGPNLNNVDAIFFMGHREVPLDEKQKAELLSFVRDDGKGFVAAHVGLTALESWPEFGELLGARFDGHPIVGAGVVINEDPAFPGDEAFSRALRLQRRVLSAEGVLARQGPRAAAARSVERAGEPGAASSRRRLSAGVGEDVRQGPGVLRLVRARVEHVGHPRRAADVSRGDQVVAGDDQRRPEAASDERAGRNSPIGPFTIRCLTPNGDAVRSLFHRLTPFTVHDSLPDTTCHEEAVRRCRGCRALPLPLAGQNNWTSFGQDAGGTKFSTLAQINTENVKGLKRAWTFHTGDKSGFFESTPLVIDGVLYFSAPTAFTRSTRSPASRYGSTRPPRRPGGG